uniref:Uncharacterized protein n=1 Tax=Meloidogyne enterolobii TaxID=390850 RepID=A0A6V7UFN3_MELEN|nr:unnamed protein product [Meloidogyne enterolobii]
MKNYFILIIILLYSMAVIKAEINMGMNGDGEENVDLIDIDSPPLQLRSRRAICVPASCLNNCDSGNCPYWRRVCHGCK